MTTEATIIPKTPKPLPLVLRLEGVAGSTIDEIYTGLVSVAFTNWLHTQATFNGVTLFAGPTDDPAVLAANYHKAVARGTDFASTTLVPLGLSGEGSE